MSNNSITINENGIIFNSVPFLKVDDKKVLTFTNDTKGDNFIGVGVNNPTVHLHLSGGDLLITKLQSKYPERSIVSSIHDLSRRMFDISHYTISSDIFRTIKDLSNISILGTNSISGFFNKIDSTYWHDRSKSVFDKEKYEKQF